MILAVLILMLVFCGESTAGNVTGEAARTYTLKSGSIACRDHRDARLVYTMMAEMDKDGVRNMLRDRCRILQEDEQAYAYDTLVVDDPAKSLYFILVRHRKPGDTYTRWAEMSRFENSDDLLKKYHYELWKAVHGKW